MATITLMQERKYNATETRQIEIEVPDDISDDEVSQYIEDNIDNYNEVFLDMDADDIDDDGFVDVCYYAELPNGTDFEY